MAVSAPSDWCLKMCELLGLPPDRTVAFELRCRVGEVVTVTAELYPEDQGAVPFEAFTKRYRLVEEPAEAIPTTPDGEPIDTGRIGG